MSREYTRQQCTPKPEETTYISPYRTPRTTSRLIPRVSSLLQPKLHSGFQSDNLEKEADEMGKRVTEGKEANVKGSVEISIQKKDDDEKTIVDKGISPHAKGTFDPPTNAYVVPEANAYDDPQQAFDTLYSISKRFGVSMEEIKKANHLQSDAVVAGQVLVIPIAGGIKNEIKPTPEKPVVNSVIPTEKPATPRLPVSEHKDEAAKLISQHTSWLMLNEETLAKELVCRYIFSKPQVVLNVFSQIDDYNTDDLTGEILNLLPLPEWNKVDKKLLKEFYYALTSGNKSDDENAMAMQLERVMNPKVQKTKEQKPVKPLVPEIKKQEPAVRPDSTVNVPKKEEVEKAITASTDLFKVDPSQPNAAYLKQMYENKNAGKWQKEDLIIKDGLSEVEQRVKIAREIEMWDERKYGQVVITNGRLTDNIVDCAEFVSEVAWVQGFQSYPSGGCDDQLNWFKKNGEWGNSFSDIMVGDVIFWDRDLYEGTTNDHTAVVVEKLTNGSVKYVHSSVNGKEESINAPKSPTTINGTAYATQDKYRLNFLAWGRFKKN